MERSSASESPTLITDDAEISVSQSTSLALVADDTEMTAAHQSPALIADHTEMSDDDEYLIRIRLTDIMKDTQNLSKITEYKISNDASNRRSGDFSEFKHLTVTAEADYNVVLKHSRQGADDDSRTLIRSAYERAIFLYTEMLPKFTQFEDDKGIQTPFDNVPKCYGTYVDGNNEMILQGDLTKEGYTSLTKLEPVEHSKLEVLLKTFGRWHAISAAMAILRPEPYREISNKLDDMNRLTYPSFDKLRNDVGDHGLDMQLIYEKLLKKQMYVSECGKWKALQSRLPGIFKRILSNRDPFKVVLHGNIQSSNIMFKDSKPVILDWKFASRNSPVYDVADLIFTCATADDLLDLKKLLEIYHKSFTDHMKELGLDEPSYFYSMADFIEEWKIIAEYGVVRSFTIMKNTFSLPLCDNAEYDKDDPVWSKLPEPKTGDYRPTPDFHVPMYHLKMLAERCLNIFRAASYHGVV